MKLIASRALTDPDTGQRQPLEDAASAPCRTCPWRIENWNRDDLGLPAVFYTAERRAVMWAEHPERPSHVSVRGGSVMLCHRHAPESICGVKDCASMRPCAGAVALTHRELLRWREVDADYLLYAATARPGVKPLTATGIAVALLRLGIDPERPDDVTRFVRLSRQELLALLHPWTLRPELGIR